MQPGAPQQNGAQQSNVTQQASQLFTQPDASATTDAPATIETTDAIEATDAKNTTDANNAGKIKVKEQGQYTDKERVALYIHTYGHLPDNYITKAEAQQLGWDNTLGNLKKVAPGKSIGGDRFGNYEGKLPTAKGRIWIECDINTLGKRSRGAERIIFSNDGLIYYTGDHYDTFELLAGTP
jgi:guanyl-specific ribonuclease Sa